MSAAPATAEVASVAPPRERAKILLPAILFLLLALAPLAVSLGMPAGWLALLTRALIFAIAALSLDLILGVGGLVSFGHAAFLGIGAYVTGIMITEGRSEALVILPVHGGEKTIQWSACVCAGAGGVKVGHWIG